MMQATGVRGGLLRCPVPAGRRSSEDRRGPTREGRNSCRMNYGYGLLLFMDEILPRPTWRARFLRSVREFPVTVLLGARQVGSLRA